MRATWFKYSNTGTAVIRREQVTNQSSHSQVTWVPFEQPMNYLDAIHKHTYGDTIKEQCIKITTRLEESTNLVIVTSLIP